MHATKSLCAHVLATAQKLGVLKSLLDWYSKENKGPNQWSLSRSSGVPKCPGDKPHGSKRKRSRVSRPPSKTYSKFASPSTATSPGNSPDPKRTSGQSVSVTVSQPVSDSSSASSSLSWHNSSLGEYGWPPHPNPYGSIFSSPYPAFTPPWYQSPGLNCSFSPSLSPGFLHHHVHIITQKLMYSVHLHHHVLFISQLQKQMCWAHLLSSSSIVVFLSARDVKVYYGFLGLSCHLLPMT